MSKGIIPSGYSGIVKLKSVLEHPEPLFENGQQYILNGKPYLRLSIQDGGGLIDLTHQSIIEVVGTFTSSLPSSPVKGIYLFAGLDGASVGGVTYHNGDSAIWDGSAWTRIPAQVIKDIKSNQTDFVVSGNNLFNKNTATLNAYIIYANGSVRTNQANWWCSDFIPVKQNTQYRAINNVRDRAYYDDRKVYISGAYDQVNTFTTPANTAYVRFSHYNSDINTAMLNEGVTALPFEPYYLQFKYAQIDPALNARVTTLVSEMTSANYMIDTLAKKTGYDSLTDVIARTSTVVRSFTDIAGVGANFNKSGQSFNAIKLYGAQRGTIADNRRWAYAQVFVKNAKEDTAILAKSPLIPVDKTSASLGEMIFPLMDSALENFITLTDASFSGATYFVYHLWFNEDMSIAYGGTTQGAMSNYAGTAFYTTTHAGWAGYTGNPSIALEHALVVNPQVYTTVPRIETKIADIEAAIELLEPETVEVILPDKIYAIVGDTLQLFYRGIIKAWNPYQYDIAINCSKGAWFPRYFEYTPVAGNIGTTTLQIKVKDNNGKVLGSKTCSLITKAIVSSPATEIKTLVIGDSLTNARIYPSEAFRRLTGSGGTPVGSALTNINFVGRKKFNGVNGVEGNSGWSWGDYLTVGRKAFTFTITPPITMPTVEAVYQDSNGKQYTMWWDYSTTSIKMLVNDMVSTPPASGTLTKVSGTGDATIAYSASVQSSGNPFWNDGTEALDFPTYVNKWLGGSVHVIYTLLTWNGQYGNRTDFSAHTNYAKTLFAHIHANYPTVKIKLMGVQVSDLRGGVRVDGTPAENTYTDTYGLMVTALNMNKAYQDLANDPTYSGYVEFVGVSSQVDSEYNMPFVSKSINTRNTDVTEYIGTNDVHPDTKGYNQIADVVFRNFVANFCQ